VQNSILLPKNSIINLLFNIGTLSRLHGEKLLVRVHFALIIISARGAPLH